MSRLLAEPQGDRVGSTANSTRELVEIDPVTAASGVIGSLGDFGLVTTFAFRDDGTLFGATGGGNSSIITIDPQTGDETLVGVHTFGAIPGLAFVETKGMLVVVWERPEARAPIPPGIQRIVKQTLRSRDPARGEKTATIRDAREPARCRSLSAHPNDRPG